ncbi:MULTISPECIES: RepB family plasmid replication initiator protein [Vibrio]|uniref:RepB family plasmid replication initiator protein n=1 Tax=Vibrio kanaloae TaxID=170673 RepID=A0ABV4LF55_9VIBR|nr:RepB family plasmid replication initiator protein [Vibrio kanaloae]OEF15671.1 hypothetical protein A132_17620 [Vibrio kanaloae 5S-149]
MSQLTTNQNLASLKKQSWYSVQNSLVEANFTHLSPQNTNALSYKFFLCAICGWQQLPHVKNFVNELWASHTPTSNDLIPDLVLESFADKNQRTVTLWFEELSEFCTVSKNKDKKRKSYNRNRFTEALEHTAKFHISTAKPSTIEEWSNLRAKVHTNEGIKLDSDLRHLSPILDFEEYDNNPFSVGEFVGHPIESITFDETKPLVSITFNIKFLHLLFATAKYTTLSLDHLSKFKSLATIRIHDMMTSRFNKQNELENKTNLNFTLSRWRAILGINESIELVVDKSDTDKNFKRGAKTLLSLTWEDIALLTHHDYLYKVSESLNYRSMDKTTSMAFDNSLDQLKEFYRDYTSETKGYSGSKGVLVCKHEAKYLDYKALVRDVFNKAADEINSCDKGSRKTKFTVGKAYGVKKKSSRRTTSAKVRGTKR